MTLLATVTGSLTVGSVSNGVASVSYALPTGLASGTYTIVADYSGGTDFTASTDSARSLTLSQASRSVYLPFVVKNP